MRTLSILLAAAALLTTAAMAQADAGSTEAGLAGAGQADRVTGAYKLSDGRHAEIFLLGTRLYMKIGHSPQKVLQFVGPNRLASADGTLSMRFGLAGDSDRIVLEDTHHAQDSIRLASNERAGRGAAE